MEKVLENLKLNNFEFKKKFGQNFITDKNLLNAIVSDAEIKSNDDVLEIGTGAGTLTLAISEKAHKVLTLEIDNSLRGILTQIFSERSNIELCFADFMKVKANEVNNHLRPHYKVVANLPYYITTPIIFKLIQDCYDVYSITIMVQKEVAERLVASAGSKDYGAISAELQSIADLKITRIVKKEMFTPQPKVDSAVVRIDIKRNKYTIKDLALHDKVIQSAFAMRRKTMSNCLKSKLGLTIQQIENIYSKLNLDKNIRGEALTVKDFVDLSNIIYDFKHNEKPE